MQDGLLPLFPLQVVLFPGAQLPLHIFEPRYREMIADVRAHGGEFGVVLANDNGIAQVGCTATIDNVLKEYSDGRLDILTVGRRRFEISMLDQHKSYLRGTVDFFDDQEGPEPLSMELLEKAVEAYRDLSGDMTAELPPKQLSFKLAQPITDLEVRQELLQMRSESDRVRKLGAYLPEHAVRAKHIKTVKENAPKNGHSKVLKVVS
jgi:Lon protease-like protein